MSAQRDEERPEDELPDDELPEEETPEGARDPGAPRRALIAARDARFRVRSFDRLAALGYRVDAVGDLVAVERRLAKDDYDLIVTDVLELPDLPAETRVVRVDPAIIDRGDAFERAIGGRKDAEAE